MAACLVGRLWLLGRAFSGHRFRKLEGTEKKVDKNFQGQGQVQKRFDAIVRL